MREIVLVSGAVWRATEADPKPDVGFVPALERRRLTPVERAAFAVSYRATHPLPDGSRATESGMRELGCGTLPVVFASRWGEIGTTLKLMTQFHAEHEMSPAGFSSSVHNAAPGAWSLFTHDRAPYTAIAARERSLEEGLLEALTMPGPVLLVYAEESTPDFYRAGGFPDVQEARAAAALFAPAKSSVSHPQFSTLNAQSSVRSLSLSFRHADLPPAGFGVFVDFLEGRADSFATADLILARESAAE